MNRAPRDNKTALRDLEQQEASDLFGNQKALHELRAKNMQEANNAAGETASSREQEPRIPPPPSVGTLVRQNTPPTLAAAHGNQGSKENSPSQLGHGFARASELGGVMVTPGEAATANNSPYSTTSPQQGSPPPGTKPSPPSVPRYATQAAQRSPPSHNTQQANPMKRQKVVHNPYQQQH